MRFELVQTYRSRVDDVGDAYADPALYRQLVGLPKLGDVEVLDHEGSGATTTLRVRYRFTGHLSPAVTAVVDPDRLTWVQESVHDLTTHHTRFRLLPDHYPDRLRASGTFQVTGDGSGTRRVVRGELKVRAPLVARRVEQAIVDGLTEYLAAEAPAVDAYISG